MMQEIVQDRGHKMQERNPNEAREKSLSCKKDVKWCKKEDNIMQERGQNDAWNEIKIKVIKMFERGLNDAKKEIKIMQEKAPGMIKTAVIKSTA